MAGQVLPNLLDEIICKIIELVGEESFYYLGDFLQTGKHGYALVHELSVLKMCDVNLMVSNNGGHLREFFLKYVNAANVIGYAGLLHAATIIGLEESIKILEPHVPRHVLSTLVVVIFNVCIGRDKEASQVFQLLAAHHADLRSDDIFDMVYTMSPNLYLHQITRSVCF
ncbi:hypothetical protein YC2023_082006 [Brassica napus]|uniref:(rape) hypothetical protein n=1 Tax=Brassica napus TaxID=3708 RepID=A0A816M281_BRANA|nr:unnamed protein product [Brassica napus]